MGDGFYGPAVLTEEVVNLVDTDLVRQLAAMLIPQKTNLRLVRCGSYHDGG